MHPAQRQKTSGWYVKLFKRHYTSDIEKDPPPVGCHVEPESAEAYRSELAANRRVPSAEEAKHRQKLVGAEVATQVEPEFVEV